MWWLNLVSVDTRSCRVIYCSADTDLQCGRPACLSNFTHWLLQSLVSTICLTCSFARALSNISAVRCSWVSCMGWQPHVYMSESNILNEIVDMVWACPVLKMETGIPAESTCCWPPSYMSSLWRRSSDSETTRPPSKPWPNIETSLACK